MRQTGFGPSPLVFMLTAEGELLCFAVVNRLRTDASTRRRSVRAVEQLPANEIPTAAAAPAPAAAVVIEDSEDTDEEKEDEKVRGNVALARACVCVCVCVCRGLCVMVFSCCNGGKEDVLFCTTVRRLFCFLFV